VKKIVIAYIPVLHQGYLNFLNKHQDADSLFIFGPEIIAEFDHLAKEIRALPSDLIRKSLAGWGLAIKHIEILDHKKLAALGQRSDLQITIPDEDITRSLVKKYLSKHSVVFDPIFLRWDRTQSTAAQSVEVDQEISADAFDRLVINQTKQESIKSSDWWRQVGAAIVKDGQVILKSHNTHLPSPHSPYVHGDPRNNFSKGEYLEHSSAIHAEAALIALAAQQGISLKGLSLYSSTFPCPPCAKLIAYSGIKKIYYSEGYSLLNQESILRAKQVKIIYVKPA
jgi:dCMP deaminase